MLKEYEIEIQEILSRVQKVEAESVGEAIDKAMALYYGQEIILDAEDLKDVDFTPITNKEGKNR
jgi:tyrosine-protein phosphatase YwqE